MPPKSDELVSTLGIKPLNVEGITKDSWIQAKRAEDGAEGLWRVHDSLYNLDEFIRRHPGGPDWIKLTKGTDITEAYEVHHLTLPDQLLKKYYIKEARTKRNSPFTFKDDGFYRTLKRQVREVIPNLPKGAINTSAVFIDMLVVAYFTFAILANTYWNYYLSFVAGNFLAMLTIAAHNYFHQKDNFRMYYFNLSLMSMRDWRISHVLSHHLHTNTVQDLEILDFEPFFQYFPKEKPSFIRYGQWSYYPFICLTAFHTNFLKSVIRVYYGQTQDLSWPDLIPFITPLTMYLIGGQSIAATLWMWTFIVMVGSAHFHFVGLNAAHHHPEIFHDGDTPRDLTDYDWGIGQLDAVMDRNEVTGSHFLVLTNFGDHALHHLFPTLDHGILALLYPTFYDVCKRFNVQLRMTSQWELVKGSFKQLARIMPNPNPPNLFKKYS